MIELLKNLIYDYTLRNVALGSAILGIVSGALGTFAVLRRQSLLGDTISHAALPGIALAFLLTGAKTPIILLLGAAFAGWTGTYFIQSIIRNTIIKEDSAQGIVLSVFFGLGLVLLTYIQRLPDAAKAGLDKFLFGQAATLMTEDIITMSILGALCLILLAIFWKEFKLLAFDGEYGSSLGFPKRKLEILLTSLIVIAIVIGLQTVGVVLMSAMVVTPGASARQWTNRLGVMVLLSAFFGALSGVIGSVISSALPNVPPGPTIVVILTAVALISIFFGSARGLYWSFYRRFKNRKVFATERILIELFELSKLHEDYSHAHEIETLRALRGPKASSGLTTGLKVLKKLSLVFQDSRGKWALTEQGYNKVMERIGGQK